MNRKEIEEYKFKLIELSYLTRKGFRNIQVGMITNTTINRAVFLLNDDEVDREVFIPYEDIVKIKEFKNR
jgi:hypothetical protein